MPAFVQIFIVILMLLLLIIVLFMISLAVFDRITDSMHSRRLVSHKLPMRKGDKDDTL